MLHGRRRTSRATILPPWPWPIDVARRDGGAFTRGLATYAQLATRYFIGDLPGAEEHFVAGEAFLSDRDLRLHFIATWTIAFAGWNAWIMGGADEARARMRRAVATIEDDAYARAVVQLASSLLHMMLGDPEQAAMLTRKPSRQPTSTDFAMSTVGLGCSVAGRRRSWVIPIKERASFARHWLATAQTAHSLPSHHT
jgi:hypothetical protein